MKLPTEEDALLRLLADIIDTDGCSTTVYPSGVEATCKARCEGRVFTATVFADTREDAERQAMIAALRKLISQLRTDAMTGIMLALDFMLD